MFSRTSLMLAAGKAKPFANFYKKVVPSLSTRGPRRMKVAGALWTVTTPKFKMAASPARVTEALRIYDRHGNKVVARARKLKQRLAKTPARSKYAKKTTTKKSKGKSAKKRVSPKRKAQRKRKTARRSKTTASAATSFSRYRTAVTHTKLTKAETEVLQGTFHATAGLPPNARVTAGKQILADLRRARQGAKKTRKISRRRRSRRKASTRSRRAPKSQKTRRTKRTSTAKKTKKTKKTKTSAKRKAVAKASTPYIRFRQQVMKRARLPATKTNVTRVQRLWFLTSGQQRLTPKGRVDMAVGLIKKAQPKTRTARRAAKPKVAKRKSTKRVRSTKRSAKKRPASTKKETAAAKKSHAKIPGRSRRHNPYLRFYREMVLTGTIPNHPRGARSKKVKQLWADTKHLKTIQARIKLGRAYATGVIPRPSPATKAATTKPQPHVAKKKVRSAAKRVSRPHPAKSMRAINFTVPSFYHENPFGAAYVALHKHVAGANPDIKMHNVSVAWAKSAFPASVKDNRPPYQRIRAAADVMKRAK